MLTRKSVVNLATSVVVNIIEDDGSSTVPEGFILVESGGIGWLWDGETLTPPPEPQKTADELQAEVRATRNQLLTASDWTQVEDAPVDKAAWSAYRQSLRDIPQQSGFPTTVVWPTQP